MTIETLINPRFAGRAVATYTPALESMESISDRLDIVEDRILKLDSNENIASPLMPMVMEELRKAQVHLYPDPSQTRLRQAIAAFLRLHGEAPDIQTSHIIAGNGVAELVRDICQLMVEGNSFRRDAVLTTTPGYGLFEYTTTLFGGRIDKLMLDGQFRFDWSRMVRMAEQVSAKVLFLVNPDNPSGRTMADHDIYRIVSKLPNTLVVLDETYQDFSDQQTRAGWITKYNLNNMVVLRSFSKSAAIAGLRLGYGVFPPWLQNRMWHVKTPADVNMMTQIAGTVVKRNWHVVEGTIHTTKILREKLYNVLGRFPDHLEPVSGSQANFVLCKTLGGLSGMKLKKLLEPHGVLVRAYDNEPSLRNYMRVTVGSFIDITRLCEILGQVLGTLNRTEVDLPPADPHPNHKPRWPRLIKGV